VSAPETGNNKPLSRILTATVLVTLFSFSLLIHFSHLGYWKRHQELYFGSSTPIMSTLDAYYFLRITSRILNEGETDAGRGDSLEQAPGPVPLLASLTALIHKASNLPIEQIAFYLPPVLGSCMAIIYTCWGCSLGGTLVALITGLAGVSSFYWYFRTCLGRFDTDCLNPFFVFAVLFLVYRFALSRGFQRLLYAVSALAMAWVFSLWWRQVAHLGLILIVFSYGASFYLPTSKSEKAAKIALLLGIGGVLLIASSPFSHALPDRLSDFVEAYAGHFALIRQNSLSSSIFPDVGKSISELQPLSIYGMAKEIGGHPAPFAVSMIGLVFLLKKNREAACFLLTGLLFALLSLTARRFLIFFIPLYALGIGYFFGEILCRSRLLERLAKPFLKWSVWLLLLAAMLWPNLVMSFTRHRGPSLSQGDLFLAQKISEQTGQQAVIWSWWDYGYFLEYLTGARAFIDGGTQTPEKVFIAAFPLTCPNPVLARNWMRFFATHDLDGLHTLTRSLGSTDKTFRFLEEILANPDRSYKIQEAYGLGEKEAWHRYLFPEVTLFLYLNADLLSKAYWWYYFGTWNPERREGVHTELWIARLEDADNCTESGSVRVGDKAVRVDEWIEVRQDGVVTRRPDSPGKPAHGPTDPGGSTAARKDGENMGHKRIALKITGSRTIYIIDDQALQGLAFNLSFFNPRRTPGFDPLAYSPNIGGVWRVE